MSNTKINENIEVQSSDQNLSIHGMFQQVESPSLARQIFTTYSQRGPLAGIFNLRRKDGTNDFELIRKDSIINDAVPLNTGLSREAHSDLVSQFAEDSDMIIGSLLRGIANEQENAATLIFLNNVSTASTVLTLSEPDNSETVKREIVKKAAELILLINKNGYLSYKGCCVLPYNLAAAFMATANDVADNMELSVGKINNIDFFINPDYTATDCYVMLKEDKLATASSGFFSHLSDEIIEAVDPDSGETKYFLFNRFSITESPFHTVTNPMFYKFSTN